MQIPKSSNLDTGKKKYLESHFVTYFLHLEPVFGLENLHMTVEGAPPRSKFSQESKSFFKIQIFPMVAELRVL